MNRRTFLQWMGAAGAALAVNPQVVLERAIAPEATTVLAPTALADGVKKFLITFHEHGQIISYEFMGFVTNQRLLESPEGQAQMDLSIRPTGEFKEVGTRCPAPRLREPRSRREKIQAAKPTMLEVNDTVVAELQSISAPTMERSHFDCTTANGDEVMIPGLRRMGEITMTINYQPSNAGLQELMKP